ncbi:hypothetical protein HA402_001220 [Bradysia odoriphaga]|nr:hypothetical protein HA402_001220 [Bradysia odoriphaga]
MNHLQGTERVLKREPTHFSELDPKTMKVNDLREELEARSLSSKGLKPQLVGRLAKALKSEETDAATPMDEDGENTEDNNATMDGDELDMTDIVVIDEYDSTKPEEPKPVPEGPTPIDERERRLLEKRYQLPDNPQIIVHPSRTAKGGKFFCHIMSLSILLDYRPEDTKEHSFEVSLFAELFNEMLIRDFGYNIYKALSALPDKPKEVTVDEKDKDKEKEKDAKKDDAKSDDEPKEKKAKRDDDSKTDAIKPKEDTKDKKDTDKEKSVDTTDKDKKLVRDKDKDKDKERSRRRRDDEADDDTFSIRSGDPRRKDKERQKYFTVDPDLLLSFVYFDQTHCGYIFEKDIEDLFYTLGLNLSRAQTRKVVGKVISRDSLYYRKLTDKPKDEKPDGTVAEVKATEAEAVEIDYEVLSKGNKIYLPVFKATRTESESMHQSDNVENGQKSDVVSSETGMVTYKGGLVDIEKLMEQMKRSEKARDETEQLLVDLRKTNSELVASNTRAKDKIKDLQSSLKSSNRKLSDTEQQLSSVNKKSNEYHSILNSIHDRVAPVFAKSSRDRDRKDRNRDDRDNKEREKDKEDDKDKEKIKCEKDKETEKDDGLDVEVKPDKEEIKAEGSDVKVETETN